MWQRVNKETTHAVIEANQVNKTKHVNQRNRLYQENRINQDGERSDPGLWDQGNQKSQAKVNHVNQKNDVIQVNQGNQKKQEETSRWIGHFSYLFPEWPISKFLDERKPLTANVSHFCLERDPFAAGEV